MSTGTTCQTPVADTQTAAADSFAIPPAMAAPATKPEVVEVLDLDAPAAEAFGPNHALVSEAENERERVLLRQMFRLEAAATESLMAAAFMPVEAQAPFLRIAAELAKTNVRIFEALERARRQGRQRVIVEHVTSARPPRRAARDRRRAASKRSLAKTA